MIVDRPEEGKERQLKEDERESGGGGIFIQISILNK